MSRLMLLDRGEELDATNIAACRTSASSIRIKLLAPLPPFRESDIVHVRAGAMHDNGGDRGRLLLCRDGSHFILQPAEPRPEGLDVIGAITGLERHGAVLAVEHGIGRLIAPGYWPAAVETLEVLRRFRHPLTPPLFQGSVEAMLAGVRDTYDSAVEAAQYGKLATGQLEPMERALVLEHVVGGGRILDIGCGGGREAVGFARLGYRVVGIDVAPRMIDTARRSAERLGVAVDFRVQSVTDLDEPPGSYDGAYLAASLNHIPGRSLRIATLKRVARALRPDGALILMVVERGPRGIVSRSRLVDAVRAIGRALGRRFSEPGDAYMREVSAASDPARACFFHEYARAEEVTGELEAAGFTAREVAPCWWVGRPTRAPLC